MMRFKSLIALAALLVAPFTHAAYVTIDEAGMDAIFSQTSFGNTPIDIRIGTITQLVFPNLLDISTDAEVSTLFSKHVGAQNVVNFYFIDTLSACGNINVNYIGCGEVRGQDFVVESVWAADPTYGANLLSHELGHNLGLGHRSGSHNLMDPFISAYSDLNAAEVAAIFTSPLVQTDANGARFILINPVLIVAAAIVNDVPEPSSALLVLAGLLALGGARKRRLARI